MAPPWNPRWRFPHRRICVCLHSLSELSEINQFFINSSLHQKSRLRYLKVGGRHLVHICWMLIDWLLMFIDWLLVFIDWLLVFIDRLLVFTDWLLVFTDWLFSWSSLIDFCLAVLANCFFPLGRIEGCWVFWRWPLKKAHPIKLFSHSAGDFLVTMADGLSHFPSFRFSL